MSPACGRTSLAAAFVIALALVLALPAFAGGIEIREFDDPVHEQRYDRLIAELRCLVCQNQTLAESNADLAKDMRDAVSRMVRAGSGRQEVIAFMTDRYGDFVRYRPAFKPATLALWLGPFILVAVALGCLPLILRRQRSAHLSAAQRASAERLLAGK